MHTCARLALALHVQAVGISYSRRLEHVSEGFGGSDVGRLERLGHPAHRDPAREDRMALVEGCDDGDERRSGIRGDHGAVPQVGLGPRIQDGSRHFVPVGLGILAVHKVLGKLALYDGDERGEGCHG